MQSFALCYAFLFFFFLPPTPFPIFCFKIPMIQLVERCKFFREIWSKAIIIASGPEEIAQSLMHRHSATVYSRITCFAPKCTEINW